MTKPESCSDCARAACPRRAVSSPPRTSTLTADLLFVYTQPAFDEETTADYGSTGAVAAIVNTAIFKLRQMSSVYNRFTIRYTPAVQCLPVVKDEKPNAKVLATCKPRLHEIIAEVKPKLIVAFGATALKQLGITSKHTDVRGRILEPETTGLPAAVLVTFSEKAVEAAQGLFETFQQDLLNGYKRVEEGPRTAVTLESLTSDYRLPTTIDEALAVIEEIQDYGGAQKDASPLSIDTETTTLRPEKKDAKIIAFCFGWAKGKAATILFDHPHAPEEYLDRLPELEAAIRKLLASPKPKILHNAKFDLKFIELRYQMPVRNVRWCTLLGEHLLDEDKKGNYGLKALTAVWLPHFCGYEDKLFDILEAVEESLQARISEKIDTLAVMPAFEHHDYIAALREYQTAIAVYDREAAEYAEVFANYELELAAYRGAKAQHAAAVAAWKLRPRRSKKPEKPKRLPASVATEESDATYLAELKAYDAALTAYEAFVPVPEPTFTRERPEKPVRLEKPPKEPVDPRSRKEKDFTTDAGFEKVPLKELQTYGAVDADVTFQLQGHQAGRLQNEAFIARAAQVAFERRLTEKQAQAWLHAQGPSAVTSRTRKIMQSHCIPASRVLGAMEYHGTRVDLEYAIELERGLTSVIERTRTTLLAMVPATSIDGAPFNINSGAHLAGMLYHQGWTHATTGAAMPPVPCLEYTAKGAESTAEKALKPYILYDEGTQKKKDSDEYEKVLRPESYFLEQLFLYKKATKARDTFLANVRMMSKYDGRIHTSFMINGTGTGRLSSANPNLQNTPSKLGGFSIKKLFTADDDRYVIVNADYKGAEVRVFTAYARDEALIKALNDGLDMHSFFASKVFGNPYEDYQNRDNTAAGLREDYRLLLDKQRTQIKRVVFGILYGAGEGKIAEQVGITKEAAREVINLLFNMFPAIREYIENTHYLVARDGYVETLFGRRRRFPLARVSRHKFRAQRQATNFKIQSTSSDIVISQLIEIAQEIASDHTWPEWGIHQPLHTLGVRLLLTVHDSLVLQWPKTHLHCLEPWLKHYGETRVREKFPWLPVPFAMDIDVGDSYGELMKLAKYIAKMPVRHVDEGVVEEQEILTTLREDAFA